MHHFYEVFSPETIKPIMVAIAAFYCACKTEDFSRKLSFLIKATYDILKRPPPVEASDTFKRLVQNIHALEATILMVIGFQTLEVKQPHVLLINAIRANKFPKEISHTSYYVCTNILHLTTLILRHSAEAIAAASLYTAAKWNSADIQTGTKGKWYHIFSPSLTLDELTQISLEFTRAFQACDIKIRDQLKNTLRVSVTFSCVHFSVTQDTTRTKRRTGAPHASSRCTETTPFGTTESRCLEGKPIYVYLFVCRGTNTFIAYHMAPIQNHEIQHIGCSIQFYYSPIDAHTCRATYHMSPTTTTITTCLSITKDHRRNMVQL